MELMKVRRLWTELMAGKTSSRREARAGAVREGKERRPVVFQVLSTMWKRGQFVG